MRTTEGLPSIDVSNVLNEEKQQQVIALGRLGWPLRRIQQETGVRRETAGAYLKAAGIAIRPPGGWGRRAPAKPANEVSPDLSTGAEAELGQNRPTVSPDPVPAPLPGRCPTSSACEPYFDFIELSLSKGRNAKAIYQDLVDSHGFMGRYASVKRFVRRLRGQPAQSACAVIVTPPAEEAQVDYGSGPMVRDPHSGRYRRTHLFVLTLGYSRKAVRLLTFQSSTRTWAELHEQACTPVSAREGIAHHRTAAVVDLCFLGWWRNDDRTGGLCRLPAQPADEAFDAGVAPSEPVAVHQVLVDGLGVSSFAQRQFDEVEGGLAGTARGAAPGQRDWRRVGGHRWPVLAEFGLRAGRQVGGHPIGRFCRCPSSPTAGSSNGNSGCFEVGSRGFPANACFVLDAPQRPAQPPQRDDLLSLLFAQDIAHVDGG